MQLVLSLFPGMDVLGLGFELEGFCVVQGPDVIFGRDIREFHPPAGRFDGVIGGPPCQSFSSLANLVRAKGLEPRFGNLIPDFSRVIEEAKAGWFLMENVPRAPDPKPQGYEVMSFLLDNCTMDSGNGFGEAQMRKRRFWFGWPQERGPAPNLWRWIETATFELPEVSRAVKANKDGSLYGDWSKNSPRKQTAVSCDGRTGHRVNDGTGGTEEGGFRSKAAPVTGRNDGHVGSPEIDYSPPRRTLAEMLELQCLPPDWLDDAPFTVQAKRKLVGNAVPLPMARAIARAVREAITPFPTTRRAG